MLKECLTGKIQSLIKKPNVDHYEVYRCKNGDHLIEVSKKDKKGYNKRRYYITVDTPDGSSRDTIPDSTEGTNSIIQTQQSKFNPLNVLNNKEVQKGAENTISKTTELSTFKKSEEERKPNKKIFDTNGVSINGKKWKDLSDNEKNHL